MIQAIADAVAAISATLRTPGVTETGSRNTFGDKQLEADLQTDRIVFDRLRACGAVETASSEESSDMHALGGSGFSVRLCKVADACAPFLAREVTPADLLNTR